MDGNGAGDRLIRMKNIIRILLASAMCAMVTVTAAGCKTKEESSVPPGQDKVTYKCASCGKVKTLPAHAQGDKC